MDEAVLAGVVINHTPDAERIHVAERSVLAAVSVVHFFLVLSRKVITETVGCHTNAIVIWRLLLLLASIEQWSVGRILVGSRINCVAGIVNNGSLR